MNQRPSFFRYAFCVIGFHQVPPPRDPPGPIASYCPVCGKTMYCYALSVGRMRPIPSVFVPNFPRILGPIASA